MCWAAWLTVYARSAWDSWQNEVRQRTTEYMSPQTMAPPGFHSMSLSTYDSLIMIILRLLWTAKIFASFRKLLSLNPLPVTNLWPDVQSIHLLCVRRCYCHVWNTQHWTDSSSVERYIVSIKFINDTHDAMLIKMDMPIPYFRHTLARYIIRRPERYLRFYELCDRIWNLLWLNYEWQLKCQAYF